VLVHRLLNKTRDPREKEEVICDPFESKKKEESKGSFSYLKNNFISPEKR
jgi:hypothetical protein